MFFSHLREVACCEDAATPKKRLGELIDTGEAEAHRHGSWFCGVDYTPTKHATYLRSSWRVRRWMFDALQAQQTAHVPCSTTTVYMQFEAATQHSKLIQYSMQKLTPRNKRPPRQPPLARAVFLQSRTRPSCRSCASKPSRAHSPHKKLRLC